MIPQSQITKKKKMNSRGKRGDTKDDFVEDLVGGLEEEEEDFHPSVSLLLLQRSDDQLLDQLSCPTAHGCPTARRLIATVLLPGFILRLVNTTHKEV